MRRLRSLFAPQLRSRLPSNGKLASHPQRRSECNSAQGRVDFKSSKTFAPRPTNLRDLGGSSVTVVSSHSHLTSGRTINSLLGTRFSAPWRASRPTVGFAWLFAPCLLAIACSCHRPLPESSRQVQTQTMEDDENDGDGDEGEGEGQTRVEDKSKGKSPLGDQYSRRELTLLGAVQWACYEYPMLGSRRCCRGKGGLSEDSASPPQGGI